MYTERINKLQVTFLVLMLYGYELISFFPGLLNMESSRPVSVAYRVFVFFLGTWVILKNKPKLTNQHFLIYFFWGLYLIRLFYDTALTSKTIESPLGDYWAFSASILICTFACATYFSKDTIISVRKWVLIILYVVNIWGLYNNITHPQIVPDDVLVRADANAALNTVSFGKSAAVMFFISFTIFLDKNKLWHKIILAVGMGLSFFNLFMAGSRGPLLQLIIAVIVYLFYARHLIHKKYVFLLIAIVITLICFFPEYLNISDLIFERFKETGFSSNDSDRYRAELFQSAWNQFLDHPFLGDSVETIFGGTYPHNLVLESLMALGFLGGVMSIIIIIVALINALKFIRIPYYNWIGAILLMDIVASFSSGSIANYLLFWPLLSLTLSKNIQNGK
ncbi:Lipid A core - O-antigen ligase and related enzymes [Chryseobacterium gleum]|uniref:Lipid A core - O-antigen ligase and related enzymes n=2 Tax=Chryseobacterium gleum TaxID=250 RepID=A0A3S4M6N2_CHRGE|nr:O-antigen ligase family protein [Chryseobacterium gleum]QQY33890.1 O-antigen ligase family protein [Chryseobacterium gleum]VEE07780.1 Lipid A core - O-antigen ligase and related enzymes [Chryseobacterium gleum]